MGTLEIIATALCALTLFTASVTDLYNRRIPNWITMPAIGIGLSMAAITGDRPVWNVFAVIFIIFFAGMSGVMGGGDLKLIMAIMAFCGVMPALYSVGIASVSVIVVAATSSPRETFTAVKNGLRCVIGRSKIVKQGRRVPFAPYLLFGFVVCKTLSLLL